MPEHAGSAQDENSHLSLGPSASALRFPVRRPATECLPRADVKRQAAMKSGLESSTASIPDVGVVMPVYVQDHDYLRAALRTILAQSYRNFLLVIVVDGAPDDIVGVIRDETVDDPRVEVVVKAKNEGVSKALNAGFERLAEIDSVEYLTWISSDNVYDPHFVGKLRNALLEGPPDLGLSYSSFRTMDPNGNLQPIDYDAFHRFQEQPRANLIDSGFVGVSFMYKKKFASSVAGYSMEPVEDYDYWLRLTELCDIRYVPEELMDYRANAPLSISKRIHSTKEQHRRWRYMFNFARNEARKRRGISAETTVVFPLHRGNGGTVEALEWLLNQNYSNYALWMIDLGIEPAELTELKQVEDPRMSYISMPGAASDAVRRLIPQVTTPFTLLYSADNFARAEDALTRMHELLTGAAVGESRRSRLWRMLTRNNLIFGRLYRTDKLRKLSGARERSLPALAARVFHRCMTGWAALRDGPSAAPPDP
jgi:glycosyltransferase involved in cell wall biosynthesis